MSNKPVYVKTGKVIDDVRAIARKHGYAIAVHGSLRAESDIDLIAVPWVSGAHSYTTLVRAIENLAYLQIEREWVRGPNRREGVIILIKYRAAGCPAYIDLNVLPRR